jgi:hypothetical protein
MVLWADCGWLYRVAFLFQAFGPCNLQAQKNKVKKQESYCEKKKKKPPNDVKTRLLQCICY